MTVRSATHGLPDLPRNRRGRGAFQTSSSQNKLLAMTTASCDATRRKEYIIKNQELYGVLNLEFEGVYLAVGGDVEPVACGDERLKSVEAAQVLGRRSEQLARIAPERVETVVGLGAHHEHDRIRAAVTGGDNRGAPVARDFGAPDGLDRGRGIDAKS